jgi:septal ring factor EnvC (AmiA/AmiB activator)
MINNLKPVIVDSTENEAYYWHLLAEIEERLNVIERDQEETRRDFAQIRADQAKVRADQAKVRADLSKIREDQSKIREEIRLELKYSEEDLKFYKDLNLHVNF